MILRASDGVRGRIVDLDTGQELRHVIQIDLASGHFECYQTNADGSKKQDAEGNYLTVRGIGRFKFIPATPASLFKAIEGADRCAHCGSGLTLPGDELCVTCRAAQEPAKQARTNGRDRNLMRLEPIHALDLNSRCEAYGCSRVACWIVADEGPASYVRGRLRGNPAAVWFERGKTVARRFYCDWHYEPPRLLDARGDVIRELNGVGPQ